MDPDPTDPTPLAGRRFPRVPAYAWAWLQRSRPVVVEASQRLTGTAPVEGFVDELRRSFDTDPFVRDVVIGVVADVAFGGRVPARRPPGASWDRGLTWWAAALTGETPREFETRSGPTPAQARLFDEAARDPGPSADTLRRGARGVAGKRAHLPVERAALADALRSLVETAEGGSVPVAAIRQLIDQLEQPPHRPPNA